MFAKIVTKSFADVSEITWKEIDTSFSIAVLCPLLSEDIIQFPLFNMKRTTNQQTVIDTYQSNDDLQRWQLTITYQESNGTYVEVSKFNLVDTQEQDVGIQYGNDRENVYMQSTDGLVDITCDFVMYSTVSNPMKPIHLLLAYNQGNLLSYILFILLCLFLSLKYKHNCFVLC